MAFCISLRHTINTTTELSMPFITKSAEPILCNATYQLHSEREASNRFALNVKKQQQQKNIKIEIGGW